MARNVLGAAVRRPPATLCVRRLGQAMLPDFKERDFLMHWVTDPSASHPEEVRISTLASKELRAIPGVRNFGAQLHTVLLAGSKRAVRAPSPAASLVN